MSTSDTNIVAMLERHGLSASFVQHTIDTSLPFLVAETRKRITYMPFDLGGTVLMRRPTSVAYDVLQNLCPDLPKVNSYDQIKGFTTVMVPDAIALLAPDATIDVRGAAWPVDKMPLYLDVGVQGFQHVYPLFDWSKAQLWGYVVEHILTKEHHGTKH